MPEPLLTRYMQPLLGGRRAECFNLINEALTCGHPPQEVAYEVIWPAMTQVERLFRDDRIDTVIDNMACRINRTVADQLQVHLPKHGTKEKRILISCAEDPREEIGAQLLADLFQSDGWDVYLLGAGVPHDELHKLVGQARPDILMIYGTQPPEVPEVRRFVEVIRDIGICPTMNIVAAGGVFDRVDGLWQEVGADVYWEHPREAVERANELAPRIPGPRKMGIVKKRRRRRKATV